MVGLRRWVVGGDVDVVITDAPGGVDDIELVPTFRVKREQVRDALLACADEPDETALRMLPLEHPQVWVAAAQRATSPALAVDLWRLAARGPESFTTAIAHRGSRERLILDPVAWARLAFALPGLRSAQLADLGAVMALIPYLHSDDAQMTGYYELAETLLGGPAVARAAFFDAARPKVGRLARGELYVIVTGALAAAGDPVAALEVRAVAGGPEALDQVAAVERVARALDEGQWPHTTVAVLAELITTFSGDVDELLAALADICA